MSLRLYKPTFPLSQYVDLIWRIERTRAQPARQRVYPDGAIALVVHLRKPTATYFVDGKAHTIRVPLLAGPYSRSFEIDPSQSTSVIGVNFRPGAARLFFPVAVSELHNTDISLSEIDPAEADRLLNDICSASGEHAQLQAMEEFLNRKLARAVAIHPAVVYAVERLTRAGGTDSIQKIQLDMGLSHTRFIQLFRDHVGLTPKLFFRVRRFRGVMEGIQKGLPVNWAELAADCGYFDQAHLIRDFRAFAGITPLAYSRTLTDMKPE